VDYAGVFVWSGTSLGAPGSTCDGWKTTDASASANCGVSTAKDYTWTSESLCSCSELHRLYCLEQRPAVP
jgi:hypothetical protein